MRVAFLFLLLLSGCVGASDSIDKGVSVYRNFCGGADYELLSEKEVRLNGLLADSGLVIAFQNPLTGVVTFMDSVGKTNDYSPGELGGDDYYLFIDKRALVNASVYCDYAIGVNDRTGSYLILNATRLLLYS